MCYSAMIYAEHRKYQRETGPTIDIASYVRLMVATRFYENVTGADGRNKVLEFVPKDGAPMLIACLWSRWTDPTGKEPDLLSFAAITDDPEPEVAAAGHDRTVIRRRPDSPRLVAHRHSGR